MTETVVQQEQAEAAESIVRVDAAGEPPRPGAPRSAARRRLLSRDGLLAFGFLSPTLLVFSVFILFPILFSFYLSFSQWNLFGGEATFVGLDNYARMFGDAEFWSVLAHTRPRSVASPCARPRTNPPPAPCSSSMQAHRWHFRSLTSTSGVRPRPSPIAWPV